MSSAYWAAAAAEKLSQGDLLRGVWIGGQFHPRTALSRGPTQKGGGASWVQVDDLKPEQDGFGRFLARGSATFALLLTHGCEVDKQNGSAPLLVAPVVPMTVLQDDTQRAVVRSGRRRAYFPLAGLPGVIEESYVDFRAISYLPRRIADEAERPASASQDGGDLLRGHLITFFTRVEFKGDFPIAAD